MSTDPESLDKAAPEIKEEVEDILVKRGEVQVGRLTRIFEECFCSVSLLVWTHYQLLRGV